MSLCNFACTCVKIEIFRISHFFLPTHLFYRYNSEEKRFRIIMPSLLINDYNTKKEGTRSVQGRNGITARFFPLRSVRFLVLRLLDADNVLYLFKEDMALFLIGVGKFCR